MNNAKTRAILSKLIDEYPRQLNDNDFYKIESKKQDCLNFLMELKQRGLIEALIH